MRCMSEKFCRLRAQHVIKSFSKTRYLSGDQCHQRLWHDNATKNVALLLIVQP